MFWFCVVLTWILNKTQIAKGNTFCRRNKLQYDATQKNSYSTLGVHSSAADKQNQKKTNSYLFVHFARFSPSVEGTSSRRRDNGDPGVSGQMKGWAGGGRLLIQERGRQEECSRCDNCSQSKERSGTKKKQNEQKKKKKWGKEERKKPLSTYMSMLNLSFIVIASFSSYLSIFTSFFPTQSTLISPFRWVAVL